MNATLPNMSLGILGGLFANNSADPAPTLHDAATTKKAFDSTLKSVAGDDEDDEKDDDKSPPAVGAPVMMPPPHVLASLADGTPVSIPAPKAKDTTLAPEKPADPRDFQLSPDSGSSLDPKDASNSDAPAGGKLTLDAAFVDVAKDAPVETMTLPLPSASTGSSKTDAAPLPKVELPQAQVTRAPLVPQVTALPTSTAISSASAASINSSSTAVTARPAARGKSTETPAASKITAPSTNVGPSDARTTGAKPVGEVDASAKATPQPEPPAKPAVAAVDHPNAPTPPDRPTMPATPGARKSEPKVAIKAADKKATLTTSSTSGKSTNSDGIGETVSAAALAPVGAPAKADVKTVTPGHNPAIPAQNPEDAVRAAETVGHKRVLAAGEAHGQILVPELGKVEVRAHVDATSAVQVHVQADDAHGRAVIAQHAPELRAHVPDAQIHLQNQGNSPANSGNSDRRSTDGHGSDDRDGSRDSDHGNDGSGSEAPPKRQPRGRARFVL